MTRRREILGNVPLMQVAMFAEVIAHAIAIIKKHHGHHIPGREDGVLRASHRIGRPATATPQKQA